MPLKAITPRLATLDLRRARPPEKHADSFLLSPEWLALMAEIKAERGAACEDPEHDPRRPRSGIRVFGDHIKERQDGGALLDKANILLRCGACHGRKTAIARAARQAARPRL